MMNRVNDNQEEAHDILSLLPYSTNAQLINKNQKLSDLNFIKSIIDFSIKALELFLAGDLVSFDAQVGENLCQIRAYKILNLSQKWLSGAERKLEFAQQIELFRNYKANLDQIIFEWETAVKRSKIYDKNLDSKENIRAFFVRLQLLVQLNDDFIFIIACYYLCHFNIRDNQIPVAINLEYICNEFHISKYRAKRLTHKYQQLICTLGCNFIMKIARQLPDNYRFVNILPALYRIADENRAVLPCYIVSEIIFYHSIQEQIPILVIAHLLTEPHTQPNKNNKIIYFLLTGLKESNTLVLTPSSPNLTKHCMVVSGEVHAPEGTTLESAKNYVNKVLEETPLKLILANTASHPQYSGKKLINFKKNPFQFLIVDYNQEDKNTHENNLISMQEYALKSGCSRLNPSLFFLRHIYASTVQDEIDQLEDNYQGSLFDAFQINNS